MSKLSFTGIGIHLKVKDIKKSREFYEGLGFKPVFGYGAEEFENVSKLTKIETINPA